MRIKVSVNVCPHLPGHFVAIFMFRIRKHFILVCSRIGFSVTILATPCFLIGYFSFALSLRDWMLRLEVLLV